MHDQANELRRLARQDVQTADDGSTGRPTLVTVTSGKGGVGTTTVSLNLAVALAEGGHRSVLVDADPNGGDIAMLCRLDERYTAADVLAGRRTVHEVLQSGPGGIDVLPGTWASGEVSDCSASAQQRLIGQLESLGSRGDFVVLDVGNGLNRTARRFCQAADLVLLVTTTELPSVMDAYASIKLLAAGNKSIPIHALVNMASNPRVADDVQRRLALACRRFLGIRLGNAGHIPARQFPDTAAEAAEPFVMAAPRCPAARQFHGLAGSVAARAAALPRAPRPAGLNRQGLPTPAAA